MKLVAVFVAPILLFHSPMVLACSQCKPLVQAEVYNHDFASNLCVLLLPLALLAAIASGLYFWDAIAAKLKKKEGAETWQTNSNAGR